MIVYTPNAATALGGDQAAVAKAGAWVANLNDCFNNSGIQVTATLVHVARGTQNFGQNGHADALQAISTDQTIISLRDTHKADLVNMMIEGAAQPVGTLGLGNLLMTPNGVPTHNKTSVWHSAPSTTFSHEIGHNHGCGHDAGNGSSLFPWARGDYFTGGSTGYRTVMSYQKTGFNTRASVFSSPTVQHKGGTTGSANADNKKCIIQTNPAVEKYR